jgi:hypothetical protein
VRTPSGIDVVFQRDRNAVQRPAPVSFDRLTLGASRVSERLFRRERDKRVQFLVDARDLIEARLGQLHGRH